MAIRRELAAGRQEEGGGRPIEFVPSVRYDAAGWPVTGHRVRLGRVSTELAGAARSASSRRLAVVGDGRVTGDLAHDMARVLTSFWACLHCRRCARKRDRKAVR